MGISQLLKRRPRTVIQEVTSAYLQRRGSPETKMVDAILALRTESLRYDVCGDVRDFLEQVIKEHRQR